MKYFLVSLVVIGLGLLMVPALSHAALVPCGQEVVDPVTHVATVTQCTFPDLISMIIIVINYLISVAALVAMYYILTSGFNLIIALGNAEKIQKAKTGLSNAVVGFAIIVLAFVFVNLLVNGLFGKAGATRPWWDPQCIYLPNSSCWS
jgi:hypothetical protein